MSDTGQLPARGSARARWARVAAGLLLVPLLAAAAALTWLALDKQGVRRVVEVVVTGLSERPFKIEGAFDYSLGRIVRVEAGTIRWGNGPGAAAPYLLEIGEFAGAVDLWSLFDWPIAITDLRAADARVRFEWDAQRRLNWRSPGAETAASAGRDKPLPLVIEKASVRNVSVVLRYPALTDELEVLVREAHHRQDAAHRLVVTGIATLDGRELMLDGRIGPFPELAVAGAVDFDLAITGPLASMTAAGAAASLSPLRDLTLEAALAAPSAADLAPRLRLPFETRGRVQLAADVHTTVPGIRATIGGAFGEYAFDGQLSSDSLDTLQDFALDLRSSGPSLGDLLTLAGLPGLPDAAYAIEARARQTARGLEFTRLRLDSAPLSLEGSGRAGNLPALRDLDLALTAAGPDVAAIAPWLDLPPDAPLAFALQATVAGQGPGVDDRVDAQLRLAGATATLTGSLSERDDLSGSRLRFGVDAPDAGPLAALFGLPALPRTRLQLGGVAALDAQQIRLDELQAMLGDAGFNGTARIDRGSRPAGGRFQGEVRGPDLAATLGPLLPEAGRRRLPRRPFSATASLQLVDGVLDIASAQASVGGSEATLVGRMDLRPPDIALDGRLSLRGDSLESLLDGSDPGQLPAGPFQLNGRLRWAPGAVHLDDFDLAMSHVALGGSVGLTGDGFARVAFDLHARGEDLAALVPENPLYAPAALPFRFAARGAADAAGVAFDRCEARLGAARATLAGKLRFAPAFAVEGFRLEGSGERLSDLGRLGQWQLTDRPFEVSASAQGDAAEQLIETLRFASGANALLGRLHLGDRGRPFVDVALESPRLDLDEIRVPVRHERRSSGPAADPDRVFSREPLPFHLLDRFDAQVSVRIDDLISHDRRWRNLVAEATLNDGIVELRRVQVDAARGKASLRGRLEPTPAGRHVVLELNASEAMIALEEMTAEELDQLPRHAVDARLSATGDSPHALASSLDGYVWIIGGQGRSPRVDLDALVGDFLTQLLKAIGVAEEKDPLVRIDCQAIFAEIEQGRVRTSPAIVLRTEHVVALAAGEIDMASEKLDFTFETTPLKGLGVSVSDFVSPFTRLTGTLGAPQIVLDPTSRPGESVAALVTGGLTVVIKGIWKSWFGSRKVCEKIAAKAVEERRRRDPERVPDLAEMISHAGGSEAPRAASPAARSREEDGSRSILDDYEGG